MTALAGYWRYGGGGDPAAACARMLRAQAMYGQEDKVRAAGPAALGRRLFRLLPEDAHDHGPVEGGDGRLLLAADLRLDNRAELGEALGIEPAALARMSDARVLMRALERWGEDAVPRLHGDFAFALWDGARERLLLARDWIGQRPLHYHLGEGFVALASMPKGLHALPDVPRVPNRRRLLHQLALLPEAGSETFFEGIERVEPGHVVAIDRDGARARRYWPPPLEPIGEGDPARFAETAAALLDEAVRARLRGSESEVAAHLSAGLDSAGVAATAARLLAPSGGRVVAFTAVPRPDWRGTVQFGRFADEGPLAAAAAALHPNIEHVRVDTAGRSPLDGLDRFAFLADRPMVNPCNAVWADRIHELARERRLSVLLTGQAGNMTLSFGGEMRLARLLAGGRLWTLAREAAALRRAGMRRRALAAHMLGPFVPRPLWRRIARLAGRAPPIEQLTALRSEIARDPALAAEAGARGLDFGYRPWSDPTRARLWVLGRVDPGSHNKAVLGGWGIDVRDPTADRRLAEYCLRLPLSAFLRGGRTRALARDVLADRLPAALVEQRRKGLQAADWHVGMAEALGELGAEIERLGAFDEAAGLLDVERLRGLVADWPEQGWGRPEVEQAYRLALLRGVAAGHFLRKTSPTNA